MAQSARQRRGGAALCDRHHLETELLQLERELLSDSYRPRPYRSFWVHEPKQRRICAADIRDRVVHHAIIRVLEPYFEAYFIHDTYACRRGKGTHRAVQRAQALSRRYRYVLQLDVRQFFASVDHAILKALLARRFKDRQLLALLAQIIDHPIPDGVPGRGLPIGNLTSQYFATFYLGYLDHFVKDQYKVRAREQAYREGHIDERELVHSVQSLLAHTQQAQTRRLRQQFFQG